MIIKPAVLEPRPAAARKQSRSRNRPRRGCSSPGQDLCKVNIAFGSPSGTEFSASTYRQGRSEPNRSLYSVCSAACGNRFFLLLAEGKLFSGSVILQDVPRILDGEKQGERRNILRHMQERYIYPRRRFYKSKILTDGEDLIFASSTSEILSGLDKRRLVVSF